MDVMFELFKLPENGAIMWPPANHMLIKRVLESGLVGVHRPSGGVVLMGMQASPDHLFLTPKGRQYVVDLGLHEL